MALLIEAPPEGTEPKLIPPIMRRYLEDLQYRPGSQFTGAAFTGALAAAGIRISMDGRGRWMDNVFIERLCR